MAYNDSTSENQKYAQTATTETATTTTTAEVAVERAVGIERKQQTLRTFTIICFVLIGQVLLTSMSNNMRALSEFEIKTTNDFASLQKESTNKFQNLNKKMQGQKKKLTCQEIKKQGLCKKQLKNDKKKRTGEDVCSKLCKSTNKKKVQKSSVKKEPTKKKKDSFWADTIKSLKNKLQGKKKKLTCQEIKKKGWCKKNLKNDKKKRKGKDVCPKLCKGSTNKKKKQEQTTTVDTPSDVETKEDTVAEKEVEVESMTTLKKNELATTTTSSIISMNDNDTPNHTNTNTNTNTNVYAMMMSSRSLWHVSERIVRIIITRRSCEAIIMMRNE